MSMSWYDPDQGRQIFEDLCATVSNIGDTLHVPAADHVWSAGQEALEDSIQAFTSGSHFFFIVAQPFAYMIGWICYWVAWFIWKYILVEGLYNHGLSQAKECFLAYWDWQTSLSSEELAMEGAVLVSLVGLYQLHRFLKRRRYLQKAAVWIDRKRRHGVKAYNKLIQKVAKVSLVLAAMVSHIGFVVAAAGVRLLVPSVFLAFAKPKVIGVLSFWIPLFLTITALFECKEEQRLQEIASEGDPNYRLKKKKKRRTTLGSKLRRRSAGIMTITSSEPTLEEELEDWLRFWMVRGAVEAAKRMTVWAMPLWCQAIMMQLELIFYVWTYCLPFIQPDSLAGQALPEARPLRVMSSVLGPYSRSVVDAVSGAIPLDKWQYYVVENARKLMPALVFCRFMKQETADWLVHALEVGRGMVIPGLTLFSPYFITRYGVVYVQFLLPISKSDDGEKELWLKYWVLHAMVDGLLYHFASFLWWIPLSTHMTFVLWCYLSIPQSTERWYKLVETEFKHFGLLPGEHEESYENANTIRFFTWIYQMLPKADDVASKDKGTSEDDPIIIDDEDGDSDQAANERYPQDAQPTTRRTTREPEQVSSNENEGNELSMMPTDTASTMDDDDGYEASGPDSPSMGGSYVEVDSLDSTPRPDPPVSRNRRRSARVAAQS